MSGRMVGEVIDHADLLYARGLSRDSVQALAVIAEGRRHDSHTIRGDR